MYRNNFIVSRDLLGVEQQVKVHCQFSYRRPEMNLISGSMVLPVFTLSNKITSRLKSVAHRLESKQDTQLHF